MVSSVLHRRVPMRILCLLVACFIVVLSGCMDQSAPPEVYATDPGTRGLTPVVIEVLGEGYVTQPIEGATVRLLSGEQTLQRTTSDADGIARFWVGDAGHHSFGIAASAAGWTDERIDGALRTSGSGSMVKAAIPLYHSELVFNQTFEWDAPATVQVVGRTSSSWELDFSNVSTLETPYARRIDTVTLRAGWENTLTAHGDFGVFLRGNTLDAGHREVRSDDDQPLMRDGPASEEITLDRPGLLEIVNPSSPEISYGVDSEETVVAPEGIPVDLTLIATFRTPVVEVAEGPPIGPLVIVLALIGVVEAYRRDRLS